MGKTESLTDLAPGIALGLLLGLSFYIFFGKRRKSNANDGVDRITSTLEVIKSRRTITPKNLNGKSLSNDELDLILEAANWAPTHKKTEPWYTFKYIHSFTAEINPIKSSRPKIP